MSHEWTTYAPLLSSPQAVRGRHAQLRRGEHPIRLFARSTDDHRPDLAADGEDAPRDLQSRDPARARAARRAGAFEGPDYLRIH